MVHATKYSVFIFVAAAALALPGCGSADQLEHLKKAAKMEKAASVEPELPTDPLERIAARLERETAEKSSGSSSEDEALEDESDKDESTPAKKHSPGPAATEQLRCPPGAQIVGAPPPKGGSMYCAKRSGFGSEKKEGPFRKWDGTGTLRFEANFFDDQLDGVATSYSPEGEKIELREYKKGIPNGRYIKWGRNGEKVIEGGYANGKKSGYFRYWDKHGTPISEGVLRDDIRTGAWVFFNRDGMVKEKLTFADGRKNGKAQTYFENGSVASTGAFADNKPDGIWIYYTADGKIRARGRYIKGRKDGAWTEIDPRTSASTSKVYGDKNAAKQKAGAFQKLGEKGFVDL